MASEPSKSDTTAGRRRGGARRLIAGLRVSAQDEALLEIVRPFFLDADSEGELAYRLWRRGLELALAEAASFGAELTCGITEELLASLVAQRLLLSMPLLQRTGKLKLLSLEQIEPLHPKANAATGSSGSAIEGEAAEVVTSLGGTDFL